MFPAKSYRKFVVSPPAVMACKRLRPSQVYVVVPAGPVSEIRFPLRKGRGGSAYAKFPHPASRFAVVGVAAAIALKDDGTIERAAIAVTGAAAAPFRASAAEGALLGSRGDANAIATAAAKAAEGITTLADLAASAEYRRHLVTVYAKRALARAIERARA